MKVGVIIGVYVTVGILFAMYIVRKNIKDNHGEYDSGYTDDDAMMTIAGSIFWPIGLPIYILARLFSWWTAYNEYKYSEDEESEDEDKCLCLRVDSKCPFSDDSGTYCEAHRDCRYRGRSYNELLHKSR